MLRSVDHWRTVLDGAIGIDVYSNNGVATGDYDNDGFDDFYVCQPAGLPNRLYRNRGDGTFEDVTEKAGVGVLDNTACALFADFRNIGTPGSASSLRHRSASLSESRQTGPSSSSATHSSLRSLRRERSRTRPWPTTIATDASTFTSAYTCTTWAWTSITIQSPITMPAMGRQIACFITKGTEHLLRHRDGRIECGQRPL